MTKRYFLDTEFLDDGANQRLVLVSIALVCSDGRELYLVSNEFDYDEVKRDDWMRDNVLAQLPPRPAHPNMSGPWRTRAEIRDAIAAFIEDPGDGSKPEVWAYFASYDWVLFCQLFGKMIHLPKHFPWLINDLKVWATHMGYTGKFKSLLPDTGHHDALCDARWNRDVHAILSKQFEQRVTLLPYVQHKYDCDWLQVNWHKGPCDCGLTALIKTLPAELVAALVEASDHVRATVEDMKVQQERADQEARQAVAERFKQERES